MEKKERELTEQEQFEVEGGSVHVHTENIVSSAGGGGGLVTLLPDVVGAVIEYFKP